jgi:hypothetical protein
LGCLLVADVQLMDNYMSATALVSFRHSALHDFPSILAVDAASCALRSGVIRYIYAVTGVRTRGSQFSPRSCQAPKSYYVLAPDVASNVYPRHSFDQGVHSVRPNALSQLTGFQLWSSRIFTSDRAHIVLVCASLSIQHKPLSKIFLHPFHWSLPRTHHLHD